MPMAQILLQTVNSGGFGSDTLIAFILGGSILTTLIGSYRFFVNMRTTERGMARDKILRANNDAREERTARVRAQREADLWQAYAGDLIYVLRSRGIRVPPLPRALRAMLETEHEPPSYEDVDAPMRALHENVADLTGDRNAGDQEPSP